MSAYKITGTISPNATTANTGEPAGTLNEQPYWTWEAGGFTWYLWFDDSSAPLLYAWRMTKVLGGGTGPPNPHWEKTGNTPDPAGSYLPKITATGTATVTVVANPVQFFFLNVAGTIKVSLTQAE